MKHYEEKTKNGNKNLIWVLNKYSSEENRNKDELTSILASVNPDISAHGYTETNLHNLKMLFDRIKRKGHISQEEFRKNYRELITGPLSLYMEDIHGKNDALWGAWYLAEDEADPYGSVYRRTFSEQERRALLETLLRPDAPGEAIGYALCLFAGLTITDSQNARFRDLYEIDGRQKALKLHARGSFPKRVGAVTEYDVRTRFAVLPEKISENILERKKYIDQNYEFPVVTDEGVFSSAEDLPIACHGTDNSRFCRLAQLDDYAVSVLKDELQFNELRAAYISKDLLSEPQRYAVERSTAYSIGRTDYAACLHAAGVNQKICAYLLGQEPEEETRAIPEDCDLYEAYRLITQFYGAL